MEKLNTTDVGGTKMCCCKNACYTLNAYKTSAGNSCTDLYCCMAASLLKALIEGRNEVERGCHRSQGRFNIVVAFT